MYISNIITCCSTSHDHCLAMQVVCQTPRFPIVSVQIYVECSNVDWNGILCGDYNAI